MIGADSSSVRYRARKEASGDTGDTGRPYPHIQASKCLYDVLNSLELVWFYLYIC